MTLAQFALAVGAPPRWVLNAFARLGLRHRYEEPLARRLALARALSLEVGMPLPRAFALAAEALKADPFRLFEFSSDDGAVRLRIDLPRFFTDYQVRMASARNYRTPRRRGPKPSRRGSAVERAAAYGYDVTLLDSSNLRRSPDERVRANEESAASLKSLRESMREHRGGTLGPE